jgi:excisionase family DNA binding protein
MDIYNTHTLAAKLGTTPRRIREYVREGSLSGFKLGGEWRFTEEDLQQFIKQHRQVVAPERAP